MITEFRYDVLVIDEGHKTKNIDTELRRNAMSITVKYHRILLTGTPLQNNLNEIWSVFDFVQKGILGEFKQFQRKYAEPIAKGLVTDARRAEKEHSKRLSEQVRKIIAPHFL